MWIAGFFFSKCHIQALFWLEWDRDDSRVPILLRPAAALRRQLLAPGYLLKVSCLSLFAYRFPLTAFSLRYSGATSPNHLLRVPQERPAMETGSVILLVILGILALFVIVTVFKTMYTVRTYTAGVVERFGKFNRVAQAGLHFLVPYCETVGFIDLQVRQADVSVETKTKDNVFVTIPVSVQYQVLQDKVYEAWYKLSSPQKQIESYVFNSILGHVPTLTLDEAFEQEANISAAVKKELDVVMSEFGYNILKALVTDIVPDAKVKSAMNDINAAQREQTAAQARGEADKILKVKQAEAEAESKALQGQGVARQRQAIIQGLQASVEQFKSAVEGSTARDVMAMVLLTQYFDTLRDIGTCGKSSTILLPNQPGTVNDLMTQIMAGFQGVKQT
jgi:regulator of protease activity HflC (stomatin/prohibitin superfamily)